MKREERHGCVIKRGPHSPLSIGSTETTVRYTLDNDACDRRNEFFHLQKQEKGIKRVVGDGSRTQNYKEQKRATSHSEGLAVIWAVTISRPYLEGARFRIRTDLEAIRWILSMNEDSGKLEIW